MDEDAVMELMTRYGELDGEIVHRYATSYAALGGSLSATQRSRFDNLRLEALGDYTPDGAFLYSDPIPLPQEENTDYLFVGNGPFCGGEVSEEHAFYDVTDNSLNLNRLEVGALRFFVKLNSNTDANGMIFQIAEIADDVSDGSTIGGCYDVNLHALMLPMVNVNGVYYQALLKQAGDWRFYVDWAGPVD